MKPECLKPQPFCKCWTNRGPMPWNHLSACTCGEDLNFREFGWVPLSQPSASSVVVSEDKSQVVFHPTFSTGTALVRGTMPLRPDHQYYWEVKVLTDTYGTDIMIGIGSPKVNTSTSDSLFRSILGEDGESYGLSYKGKIQHDGQVAQDCPGFCQGTLVGVRVDMWEGTLEFYLNRKPQGVVFHNLRRHPVLYPMLSSTAAQSAMRLTYAGSCGASLLTLAARALAAARPPRHALPPGLGRMLRGFFWLMLPSEGCLCRDADDYRGVDMTGVAKTMLSQLLPNQYSNGYYVDNIPREYRLVVLN